LECGELDDLQRIEIVVAHGERPLGRGWHRAKAGDLIATGSDQLTIDQ
jgi:hypothetical protein